MDKKSQYITSSAIILVLGATLWFGFPFFVQNDPWIWSVEIGDEFTILVDYYTWFNPGFATPDQNASEQSFMVYLRTTLTSLPNLSLGLNPESFRSSIMNHMKTVTTFQNGSSINDSWGSRVNSLISQTTLPTGNWLKIQSFYNNTRPTYFPMNVESTFFYTSLSHDSYLVSSGSGDFYHVSREWKSYVNLTAGFPLNITDSSSSYWGDGSNYGYRIKIWIV